MHIVDTALSVFLYYVLKQVVCLWFPKKVAKNRPQKCPIGLVDQLTSWRRQQKMTDCETGYSRLSKWFMQTSSDGSNLTSGGTSVIKAIFRWRTGKLKSGLFFYTDLSTPLRCQLSITFKAWMPWMLFLYTSKLFTKSIWLFLSEWKCHVKPNQMQLYLVFVPVERLNIDCWHALHQRGLWTKEKAAREMAGSGSHSVRVDEPGFLALGEWEGQMEHLDMWGN